MFGARGVFSLIEGRALNSDAAVGTFPEKGRLVPPPGNMSRGDKVRSYSSNDNVLPQIRRQIGMQKPIIHAQRIRLNPDTPDPTHMPLVSLTRMC